MAYEITPQDFCLIVKNPPCQGTETESANAEIGHQDCNHCKGNYFVGGECNYGGKHTMHNDLRTINQNFRSFDVLVKQQVKLSKSKNETEFNRTKQTLLTSFTNLKAKCEDESGSGFFYGSCIGLDGSQSSFSERIKETFKKLAKELGYYMKQVEKSSWQQLHQFQQKIQQLNKLSQEAVKLTEDWKNETDPIKKAQLFALLSQKNNSIAQLRTEIKNDPTFAIFDQEKSDELANIVQNIFQNKDGFFNWQKEDEQEQDQSAKDKYFGIIPKDNAKSIGLVVLTILGVVVIYQVFKSKFKH